MLKLNWDAACNVRLKRIGLGAIVRDENGQGLGSIRCPRAYHLDPFTTEALALVTSCSILQGCRTVKPYHRRRCYPCD